MKSNLGTMSMPMLSADGSGGGGTDGDNGSMGGVGGNSGTDGNNGNDNAGGKDKGGNNSDNDNDYIERLINARVDKAMEKANKDKAELEKQLAKLRKEKLTAEEVQKLEDEKKAKDLADREAALQEKENRYYAVSAIKKAGLDDGSDTALKVVDLVMGADESEINNKITALKELVSKIVESKVNEKFKAAGRNPNSRESNDEDDEDNNRGRNKIAELLGKSRAEQAKRSQEVLSHYLK